MTLDDAVAEFDNAPSDKVCANLLRIAAEYHADEMIHDSTFRRYVERVAEWLADDNDPDYDEDGNLKPGVDNT